MKKLLILRHAQALGTAIGGSDKSRELSPKGQEDALALGTLMAKQGFQPDIVLCSAATRTRQTLDNIMKSLAKCKTEILDKLYNADFDVLLDSIRGTDADKNRVLIVAHNPGIHTLAARLAKDDASAHVDRLSMAYMPATLSVLECNIEDWADLKPYANIVRAIHETTDYNAPERPTRWM